jgi:hypothetical protein
MNEKFTNLPENQGVLSPLLWNMVIIALLGRLNNESL